MGTEPLWVISCNRRKRFVYRIHPLQRHDFMYIMSVWQALRGNAQGACRRHLLDESGRRSTRRFHLLAKRCADHWWPGVGGILRPSTFCASDPANS